MKWQNGVLSLPPCHTLLQAVKDVAALTPERGRFSKALPDPLADDKERWIAHQGPSNTSLLPLHLHLRRTLTKTGIRNDYMTTAFAGP